MKKYRPLSLRKIRTYPLSSRPSKVKGSALASVHARGATFGDFISGLPDVLAASDLKKVVGAIVSARQNGRPVVLGMGAHPIKVGLSRVIMELLERGIVTALATNGACIVHDFELSFSGGTSEDVAASIKDGSFGMAADTGTQLNKAINRGVKKGMGIGRSVGEFINESGFRHRDLSLFGAGARLGLPVSVHVAVGTDIIHMHPQANGAAIGEGSMRDFRLFASVVADLEGGVYINLGSAVLLPEVFLKALSVARNLGHRVEDITTVNMDFVQHYRCRENVLRRPILSKGASYALTGHHEIMFPLLAASVLEELDHGSND
jgi:hypothetical protein